MLESIKKSLLLSIGCAVVTKEKLEELFQQLIDKGKLNQTEADKLKEDLLKSGEQEWADLQNKIKKTMKSALDSMDVGKAKDVEKLQNDLRELEKRLAILEAKNIQDNS